MARNFKKTLLATGLGIALMAGAAAPAFATEGYFMHGVGARNKAMAGAGIADTRDAADTAVNPAGLFDAGNQFQASISAFHPLRQFEGTGQGFTPSGVVESGNDWFPVPSVAYTYQYNDHFAFGLSLVANGGMNTTYPDTVANPACAQPGMPASTGVFCGGKTGVDLNQALIQPTFAWRPVEAMSFGVAPILAMQRFKALGLAVFSPFSVDPANLTNNDYDWSSGIGVKIGTELKLSPAVSFGAAWQPKITMDRFQKYRGLFADGGKFDIPGNWQVGLTWKPMDNLSASFDVRRIYYSDVASVGNSSRAQNFLGNVGGPGFGWSDVTSYKIGVEYTDAKWTWRAGFAHNNNPISTDNVTLNILAPGVQENHITGGFNYKFSDHQSLDAAVMYSPSETVSGSEVTPFGVNPFQQIELSMKQWEFTIGYKWDFN